jgi:hypothetical protein
MNRTDFATQLFALAKLCGMELDKTILNLYDEALSPLGYERICSAINHVIIRRKSRDPFPSIQEIRSIIVPEKKPDHEAVEAAARIIQAVSKFGWCNGFQARQFIGELGWRLVERFGGWTQLCESMTRDNVAALQAQFRNLAKAQIERAAMGLDDIAPTLDRIRHDAITTSESVGKLLLAMKNQESEPLQ